MLSKWSKQTPSRFSISKWRSKTGRQLGLIGEGIGSNDNHVSTLVASKSNKYETCQQKNKPH